MAKFKVFYYAKAEKDLNTVESEETLRIVDKIEKLLSNNPFPRGRRKKKIHGVLHPLYRLRIDTVRDSYRTFYLIEKDKVVILRIVKKKDAEKAIKSLKKGLTQQTP